MKIPIGIKFQKYDGLRDAIHQPIVQAFAGNFLDPGAHVKLENIDNTLTAVYCDPDSSLGIVDPFLKTQSIPGDIILVWMKPNTISEVYHHWTHKDF